MEGLQETMAKGDIDETREHFDTLLAAYPSSGLLWYSYAQFEYRLNNTAELEAIFAGALKNVLDLRLWRLYLQHVRRVNRCVSSADTDTDTSSVVMKAYEFCLSNIGHDVYSGATWLEYVEFVKALPLPEADYERQQRVDGLRKTYAKALSTPLDGLEYIWHSYDHFESVHNKAAAKKMLSDRSPVYMHCRGLVKGLKDVVDGIDRDWMAVDSIDQDDKWNDRLVSWMRWIDWERGNPAKLDKPAMHHRIVYAFRRALACCKYIPEVWMALLLYIEEHPGLPTPSDMQPMAVLRKATELNPKSLILSFTLIDRLEQHAATAAASSAHETCKGVFEALIASITGARASDIAAGGDPLQFSEQEKSDLSLAFLHYMQWTRRSPGGIAGARAVFTRARRHPAILHPVFTANALMEYHVRKDAQVASKIFELGLGRFGSAPGYLVDYAQYLIGLNDDQNVRALFERAVSNLLVSNKDAAYGVWCIYLDYESKYGEAESYRALAKRFKDVYPGEDPLAIVHRQYSYDSLEVALVDYKQSPGQSVDPTTLSARIGRQRSVPFVVGEHLIDLLGRLPLPSNFDGPRLDPVVVLQAISQVRIHGAKPEDRFRRRSRSPDRNRRR